jgi:putative cell wall-binding protein
MAAPYVSGVAGLLRSLDQGLTADQVEGLLEAGAETGDGRNAELGWGLVNAGRSVALLLAGQRPVPAADPAFPVGGSGSDLLPPPTQGPQVFRISAGSGRTAAVPQAVAVSRTTFEDGTAEHAVLTRPDLVADALAGSSLTLGLGPLLYAEPTGPLPSATRAELVRALPRGATVYLLGGAAALPVSLEAELSRLGFRPQRLSGTDRESTAAAVARELVVRRKAAELPASSLVVLATAENWPDAVAAGAVGAYYGLPILVTPTARLHPATANALRDLRPSGLLVLGGPTAVSPATYASAVAAARVADRSAVRLAGGDRYGTAIALAEFFEESLAVGGVSPRCVVAANVVRADGWAHVLSASPLAGAYGCVVVPVQGAAGDRLPAATRAYVSGMRVDAVLAGDRDVISSAVHRELGVLLAR